MNEVSQVQRFECAELGRLMLLWSESPSDLVKDEIFNKIVFSRSPAVEDELGKERLRRNSVGSILEHLEVVVQMAHIHECGVTLNVVDKIINLVMPLGK